MKRMVRTLVYEGTTEFIDLHVVKRWVKNLEGKKLYRNGTIEEKSIRFYDLDEEEGGEPEKEESEVR